MSKIETIHSISDYVKAYETWLNTPAVINSDGMMVKVNDAWYPKAEYDAHNPKPNYQPKQKRDQHGALID